MALQTTNVAAIVPFSLYIVCHHSLVVLTFFALKVYLIFLHLFLTDLRNRGKSKKYFM